LTAADWGGPLLLSILGVACLVITDFRHQRRGGGGIDGTAAATRPHARYLCKPPTALEFVWLAIEVGATGTVYGRWLLAGLTLCLCGDVLLMFERPRCFLAGLVAFLCGHLLYCMAFLQLPLNPLGPLLAALPAAILFIGSLHWLWPHLPVAMRTPVVAYIGVISAMLLCASASWGSPGGLLIVAGATGFALSDLAVARRRFVAAGAVNGLWGTPLYFGSQMLLAGSAAVAGWPAP
jgi:uncharacterized membrane protein YhhN